MTSTTAVNCEEDGGHCLHGGTAVGSLYCCHCGNYDNRLFPTPAMTYERNPYLQELTAKGLEDIREGRIHKIPNIKALRD